MIGFDDIDMMARGGSIAMLLLWIWLLVRDNWQAMPARVGILLNISIIMHVIAAVPGPSHENAALNFVIEIGSAAVPGFFWLFAKTWFNDETRVSWQSWVLIALCLGLVAVHLIIFDRTGEIPPTAVAMRVAMFGFAIAGLWAAWSGRDGDLVEARRILRTRLVWSVGLFVILTNVAEILVFLGHADTAIRSYVEFGIALLTWALCATMFGHRQAELFAAAKREPARAAALVDDPLASRLLAFVEHERVYRDETLTIAKLAALLGEQEYRLRRLINGQLGHRNFAAFLNGYRLAEVKQALADPGQKDVPILTIALDAGFGSLGPFNRAFREAEGMTPSSFRTRQI